MAVGAVIGLVVALLFIGGLALFDAEVHSGVVGAVAGAVAGAAGVVLANRMRSV
jgi:hypothetical protein